MPIRVQLHETPTYFLAQDWALGLFYTKIGSRLITAGMFGESEFKKDLEQVIRNGVRGVKLYFTLSRVVYPVLRELLILLCVPYVVAYGVFPWRHQLIGLCPLSVREFAHYIFSYFPFVGVPEIVQNAFVSMSSWNVQSGPTSPIYSSVAETITIAGGDASLLTALSPGTNPFSSELLSNSLMFRCSFLVFLVLRCSYFTVFLLRDWFLSFQTSMFEERWLIGKRLVNVGSE